MGLPTLEFSDSFLDSPEFRERLQCHEIELERTNRFIKDLIKDGNMLISALRSLSLAVQRFSQSLQEFQFECIGDAETDDEINIAQSLKEFSQLLSTVEEERKRLIQNADDVLISPLERFRKEQIGAVKEEKKQFHKETERYYSVLEKHLSLSSKKKESQLHEVNYLIPKNIHQVPRCSNMLKHTFVWGKNCFNFCKIKTEYLLARNNFESTRAEVERLMKRIRSAEEDFKAPSCFTMEGYLYIQEKRPLGSVWTRYYCTYEKSSKMFTMSSTESRPASRQNGVVNGTPEMFRLRSCVRRKTDSIDKRFCFDIEVVERHGVITLQALSEANRRLWMEAMDGKEPIYTLPSLLSKKEETFLNEVGFNFVKKCIEVVETRGITTLGLYRTGGVNSKVHRLMTSVFASTAHSDIQLDADAWDNKTITSGLKNYFRCLAEPLLTYRLHKEFLKAAKYDDQTYRVRAIHALVHKLPEKNRAMLDLLTNHLHRVSSHSDKNLMTVSNLGMIFGPTLMRSQEETVAAMMNIKFQNIVVEIIIENHGKIFGEAPDLSVPLPQASSSRSTSRRNKAICLSSGKRKARLYPPALCLADNDSDTFSSSPSMTPMGSQESLSSHSSEKNGLSQTSPPSSPTLTDNAVSPHYTPSRTSSQLTPAQHTSSVSSSASSLISVERNVLVKGNSTASLSSVKESSSPSRASSSTTCNLHSALERTSSFREGQPVQRVPSVSSLTSSKSVDEKKAPSTSSTATETRVMDSTSPSQQQRTSYRTSILHHSLSHFFLLIVFVFSPREAKALYSCEAEHSHELSFPQGALFSNVYPSVEPGWLQGTYNGKMGLIPENYITYM
uniref:Rho GTPase-activating protein 42 n=1 Tax=Mastacembelus armatus TaxID=205130 RepID=A0A7N8WRU5_9TELE